ncbi:MAG: Gfo/Idh/MocA family oxidoreductase [Planctomycetota bacterium]
MAKLKVGLMGYGFMGKAHAACYCASKKGEVVAIWDANPALLDPKAQAGGNLPTGPLTLDWKKLKTYTDRDAKKFFADPDIDMVDICLPTPMHMKFVRAAAKAGKHILSEKPICLNSKEAEETLKIVRKAGVKWMVAQCVRFWPEYDFLKKIVDSKKLGKLITLSLRRVAATPGWGQKNWILKGKLSGGALFDLSVHDTDYAYYLLGMPKKVRAAGRKDLVTGAYDVIYAQLIYDKPVVNIESQWVMTNGFQMYYLATFEKGVVEFDCAKPKDALTLTEGAKVSHPKMQATTGWNLEIEYFLDCVQKGKDPKLCMPESSIASLKIAEAEVKAANTGKTVRP